MPVTYSNLHSIAYVNVKANFTNNTHTTTSTHPIPILIAQTQKNVSNS